MAYDLPQNVSTTTDMFHYVNSVVQNWFFPGAILSVFFIIMIKMLFDGNTTPSRAFSSASFSCMVISVFCRLIGLVDTQFMSLFIVFTALGALWMYIDNN